MADEGKLQKQAERGERARRLIGDDLFLEAFEKIGAEIRAGWENSGAGDHEGRHNAYLMIRLLKNVRGHFEQIALTGKQARGELLRIDAVKESAKKRRQRDGA